MKPKIAFLVGPTAIGKTDIAAVLAKKINAEIISCDSMQIYKGMDIITSKPRVSLQKKVKHHLLNLVSPRKEYNVSKYRQEAIKVIHDIHRKSKIPLFVGGAGLYMSVLVDGIFKLKTQDKALRNKFYAQAEKFGSRYLHDKLRKIDRKAAVKIHPNDAKRIIRALEVFKATGRPISELQKLRDGLIDKYDVKIFCLDMPRHKLYQRIDARVEKMFSEGLIKEVRRLFKNKLSKTASSAIGIKELKGYFDRSYDLGEAKRLIKRNSRRYAKRQLAWFRKDKRIQWIEIKTQKPKETVSVLIEKLF